MANFDAEAVFEEFEVEHNGEYCWSNKLTRTDFLNVVKAMGWEGIRDFFEETGCEYDDIKGRYWAVIGNPSRIFIVG